jgi:hypothetical protein
MLVDDATSQSGGAFSEQETIWAAAGVLRRWVEQYGVPLALYTDWKNVYVRAATAAEEAAGVVPYTQFGRMCAALAIAIIPASSPQVKGRVERNHGTHQDRLIKKLRRLGIADDATANQFLEATYWAAHNARFAQPPAAAADFHRPTPSARVLDRVFRLEETRTVSQDWVVRYRNRAFQLRRETGYAPARGRVTVCEWEDGRVMRWTEITGAAAVPVAPLRPVPAPRSPTRVRRPAATHPWRRDFREGSPPLWHVAKS